MPEGVTITLTLTLKPETADAYCAEIPEMLHGTRAFPGFRDIRVVRNRDNPNQIILIQQWDSSAAYDAYIAWRTETGVIERTASFIAEPPQLVYWDKEIA